jgi:hypothetical protein
MSGVGMFSREWWNWMGICVGWGVGRNGGLLLGEEMVDVLVVSCFLLSQISTVL